MENRVHLSYASSRKRPATQVTELDKSRGETAHRHPFFLPDGVHFLCKIQKRHAGKLQAVIEDLDLPNPVIRSHYKNGFLKQYVRDDSNLRTEPATNMSPTMAWAKLWRICLN